MKVELKPCPFCGNEDLELYLEEKDGLYDSFVRCKDCGALLGECARYVIKEECESAIANLWNKHTGGITEIAEAFNDVASAAIETHKNMLNMLENLKDCRKANAELAHPVNVVNVHAQIPPIKIFSRRSNSYPLLRLRR